nr:catalase [Melaminivora alkalimesophila]
MALSFPVFIIQDAMKFVDLVHAIKPNPVTDVPQACLQLSEDSEPQGVLNARDGADFPQNFAAAAAAAQQRFCDRV